MTVVLACDLGGTSFRAALVDADGAMLAEASVPAPAAAEPHPDEWWAAFLACCGRLAVEAAWASVRAVAICGVTRTQIFLGRDGIPLPPGDHLEGYAGRCAGPAPRRWPRPSGAGAPSMPSIRWRGWPG